MVKILLVILSLGYTTTLWSLDDNVLDFERKGFHFGLGIVGAVIETDPHVLPFLALDVGYNFTETFSLSVTSKTSFALLVGVEAKLYTKESADTWFATIGLNRLYGIGSEHGETLFGAGVGYALEHAEVEVSVAFNKEGAICLLTYKYIW